MQAFARLQEEIIKTSDDHSIFAWKNPEASWWSHRGLLARSPVEFGDSAAFEPALTRLSEPFSMTNKGLRISLSCCYQADDEREFYALLDCKRQKDDTNGPLTAGRLPAVLLRRLWEKSDQVVRVHPHELVWMVPPKSAQRRVLYVRNVNGLPTDYLTWLARGVVIEGPFLGSFRFLKAWPECEVRSSETRSMSQPASLKLLTSSTGPTTYKMLFELMGTSRQILIELQAMMLGKGQVAPHKDVGPALRF